MQGGNARCRQTHLDPLCEHRQPRHQCQLNCLVDKSPKSPNPPSLSSSHTTVPDSLGPESHTQEQRTSGLALLGQGLARAVPALTLGKVKHTVPAAMAMLWACPYGTGWLWTRLDA